MTIATAADLRTRLAEHFPPEVHRELEKGGKRFTYVPGREVEERLNIVLGNAWSWETTETFFLGTNAGNPTSVLVSGVLTIVWPDGVVQKMAGEGGVTVKFTNTTDKPVDLGDELKGAATDALKKAAQRIGVAAYLARREDAIEAVATQAANHDAQADVLAAELVAKDRDAQQRDWQDFAEQSGALATLKAVVDDIPATGEMRKAWTAWRNHIAPTWPPTRPQFDQLMERVEQIIDGNQLHPGEEEFGDRPAPDERPPWLATVVQALVDLKGAQKSALTRMRRRSDPPIGDDPGQWTDEQARAVLDFIAKL